MGAKYKYKQEAEWKSGEMFPTKQAGMSVLNHPKNSSV